MVVVQLGYSWRQYISWSMEGGILPRHEQLYQISAIVTAGTYASILAAAFTFLLWSFRRYLWFLKGRGRDRTGAFLTRNVIMRSLLAGDTNTGSEASIHSTTQNFWWCFQYSRCRSLLCAVLWSDYQCQIKLQFIQRTWVENDSVSAFATK